MLDDFDTNQWPFSIDTLYHTPANDPERFIQQSRLMFVLVGIALGATIAWWAWRLGGASLDAVNKQLRVSGYQQQVKLDQADLQRRGNELIDLSPREWMLLDLLLTQRDRVVTKDQIAESWALERSAESGSGAGSIEVYIHRLRRKLEGSGLAIRTVRGLGYLLEEGDA